MSTTNPEPHEFVNHIRRSGGICEHKGCGQPRDAAIHHTPTADEPRKLRGCHCPGEFHRPKCHMGIGIVLDSERVASDDKYSELVAAVRRYIDADPLNDAGGVVRGK